ncbi:hypothetical protein BDW22DRAFT_27854 [Trametopsis cervina]|nr:hypothetical protein BDW22DRAFT_27854 [Trametopsis cervina]
MYLAVHGRSRCLQRCAVVSARYIRCIRAFVGRDVSVYGCCRRRCTQLVLHPALTTLQISSADADARVLSSSATEARRWVNNGLCASGDRVASDTVADASYPDAHGTTHPCRQHTSISSRMLRLLASLESVWELHMVLPFPYTLLCREQRAPCTILCAILGIIFQTSSWQCTVHLRVDIHGCPLAGYPMAAPLHACGTRIRCCHSRQAIASRHRLVAIVVRHRCSPSLVHRCPVSSDVGTRLGRSVHCGCARAYRERRRWNRSSVCGVCNSARYFPRHRKLSRGQ